jgi:hypothetical protein
MPKNRSETIRRGVNSLTNQKKRIYTGPKYCEMLTNKY